METNVVPFERFRALYRQQLERLKEASPRDLDVSALWFVEEACENSGSGDYVPEWMDPFSSIAGRAVLSDGSLAPGLPEGERGRLAEAMRPALLHAIRLGYTEGYFEAKADA